MKKFRIGVVGSGAIGSYYGGKLAAAGRDVHFLMRGDLSEIRREGLRIHGAGEDLRVAKINAYNSTKEIGPCDLVLLAVKTTSNDHLVDLVGWRRHRRDSGGLKRWAHINHRRCLISKRAGRLRSKRSLDQHNRGCK